MPLCYFVRSGHVDLPAGSLRGAGINGNFWSSAANSSTAAYYLAFPATNAGPSYSYYRYYAFSVRCVAL